MRPIRFKFILLIFVVLISVPSFAFHRTVLTDGDSGKTVTLQKGDLLDIVLSENPTTGYIWTVISSASPLIVVSSASEYSASSRLIGAGGKRTMHFKAMSKGSRTLKLGYRRHWEKVPPIKTLQVTIKVN